MAGPGPLGKVLTVKEVTILLLLMAVTVLVYLPAMSGPFVFDDSVSIQRNLSVQFGSSWGVRDIIWRIRNWDRPLLYGTFRLQVHESAWAFHLVNLVIHLFNAWIVLCILRMLFPITGALAGTALFLLHPLQTESVAYISSRSELLAATIVLLGLCLFIRHYDLYPWRAWAIVGIFTLIGFGFKPTVIVLPVLASIYDAIAMRRLRFLVIPLLMTVAIVTLAASQAMTPAIQSRAEILNYYQVQGFVAVRHIGQFFWPSLSVDWAVTPSFLDSIAAWVLLLPIIGLLLTRIWVIQLATGVILTFWIPRSLMPAPDIMAEHRVYVPMLGAAMFAAMLWQYLPIRRFMIGAVVFFSFATASRSQVWASDVALWRDASAKSPLKPRPRLNLALAEERQGHLDAAWEQYQNAVLLSFAPNIRPLDGEIARTISSMNMASMLINQGRMEDAHLLLKTAWLSDPDFPGYAADLGAFYLVDHSPDKAIAFLTDGIAHLPEYPWFADGGKLYLNRGIAHQLRGECAEAIADFREMSHFPGMPAIHDCSL